MSFTLRRVSRLKYPPIKWAVTPQNKIWTGPRQRMTLDRSYCMNARMKKVEKLRTDGLVDATIDALLSEFQVIINHFAIQLIYLEQQNIKVHEQTLQFIPKTNPNGIFANGEIRFELFNNLPLKFSLQHLIYLDYSKGLFAT
jgi:hypothetical protein